MMLYRYTDLNNLALILKNKRIRLASLNDLDDISEGRTRDMGILGHYVFVSCWTDLKEESLPFWNMYTPNMAGVRIGIPYPYLKIYDEVPILRKGLKYGGGKSYVSFSQRHGQGYYVLGTDFVQIEYTDDSSKLNNKCVRTQVSKNEIQYAFGELGKYKKTHWKFQSEWRFRAFIVPSSHTPPDKIEGYDERKVYEPMVEAAKQVDLKKVLDIDCFPLEIDSDAFSNMEILLGPRHKSGDLEIVKALAKMYNPTAKIEISNLSGDIR